MAKIGKLIVDKCEIGIMGTGFDIDEANITNTGIAAWDGMLRPAAHPNEQTPSGPLPHEIAPAPSRTTRAVRASARFMRDVSAGTIAAVIGATIKPF